MAFDFQEISNLLQIGKLHDSQSAVEIRQRTDRLHTFSSLDEAEETLTWFIEYPHCPLVRRIPVGEGTEADGEVYNDPNAC